MKEVQLKDVKKGEFFTLTPVEEPTEKQVWVRYEYCRSEKKFECHKFEDVCHCNWFKGTKMVNTDFIF